MPYKDPFDDVVEVPNSYKRIYGVFACRKKNLRYSCFKFRRKQKKYNPYKFMDKNSMFNQVQVMLKLLMWRITSKEKFSTKVFLFDYGRFMNLSTLEDGYNSRMNLFQEGGNDKIKDKEVQTSIEFICSLSYEQNGGFNLECMHGAE